MNKENKENLIPVKGLSPFKRFCMTIGELPSSYLETMTYYEMLVWFTKYMQDTVIPTINNNASAVDELQDKYIEFTDNLLDRQTTFENNLTTRQENYEEEVMTLFNNLQDFVNNYFNNLDVQEEINNKLDQMVEDGILQEIIADYLNSKAIFGFDNVAQMKEATNLINGSFAKTLGYYSKNDGGSGLYKIREITNSDVIDEATIIAIGSGNLIAELVINETINNMQLGINEELTSENLALITSKFNDLKIITDLEISSYLNIENLNIIGESKTITLTGDDKTIIHFKNCDVKGLNFTSSTFKFIDFTNSNIDKCSFYQCGLQKPTIDNTSFKVSNCYFDLNNINEGTLSEEAIHIMNCSIGEISNNKFVNSKQDFIDLYPGGKNIEIFGNEFTCTNVAMEIKVILADEGDPEGGSNLHNLHNENINIHDNVFNWNINSNSQTYLIVGGLQVDRRADTSTELDFYLHNLTIHNNTFNVTSEVGVSGNYNIIWTKEVKGLVFYDNLIKNHAQQVGMLYISANTYNHSVYSVVELLNNTFITDNNCKSELCSINAPSTITAENNIGLSHLSVSSSSVVNDTHIILKNNRHTEPANYTRVYGEYVYVEGDNLDKIQFYATNLFLKNVIQVGNTGNTNLKGVTNLFITDSKIHKLNVSDPVVNVLVNNTIYDNNSPFLSPENITTKQESSVIIYSGN